MSLTLPLRQARFNYERTDVLQTAQFYDVVEAEIHPVCYELVVKLGLLPHAVRRH